MSHAPISAARRLRSLAILTAETSAAVAIVAGGMILVGLATLL